MAKKVEENKSVATPHDSRYRGEGEPPNTNGGGEVIDPETGEILSPGTTGQELTVPADAMSMLEKYSGAGYSDKPEDGLTPVLSILQDNSGEIKRQHERHLDGAEAGMMIIRSLQKVYPGENGLIVQPFGFNHVWVEWTGEVGEGSPVARFEFDDPPADMVETPDPQNPARTMFRRKSTMNRMVDTREHAVNVLSDGSPFPVVVPFSGSNHSVSRLWTNMMKTWQVNGMRVPAFFRSYKLRTVFRKKGSNQTWYGYQISPGNALVTNRALLQLGADSFEAMKAKPIEGDLADYGHDADIDPHTGAGGQAHAGAGAGVDVTQHI